MYIHHLRKTTSGSGGNMSHKCSCGGKVMAKPHRRILGNGISPAVYDTDLGVVKPTKVLQNGFSIRRLKSYASAPTSRSISVSCPFPKSMRAL